MDDDEIWKPAPSYPDLMASSWGRVRLPESEMPMPNGGMRKYAPKPRYGSLARNGQTRTYTYRNLFNGGVSIKVHRIVCDAFHGPCPEGLVCMHINEDAHDNRPENLRWATQKENQNAPGLIAYRKTRVGELNSRAISKRRKATNE